MAKALAAEKIKYLHVAPAHPNVMFINKDNLANLNMETWKIFNSIGIVLILAGIIYFSQTVFDPLGAEAKIALLYCFAAITFLVGWILKGRDK